MCSPAAGSLRICSSSAGFWQFRRGITATWRARAQPVTSGQSLPVTVPPRPQLKYVGYTTPICW